jgi:GGDEF domain-containing protein
MSADFLTGQDSLAAVAAENERLGRRTEFWRRAWLSSAVVAGLAFLAVAYLASNPGLRASRGEDLAMAVFVLFLIVNAAVFLSWRSSRRSQNALGHWTGYLRARRHFYDRLALECEKAHTVDSPFSVLLVRLVGPRRGDAASVEIVERALAAVASGPRRDDVAVAISPSEIAVLSLNVRGHDAPWLVERLKIAVVNALRHEPIEVRIGWAVYSERTPGPNSLIERALASLDPPQDRRVPLARAA